MTDFAAVDDLFPAKDAGTAVGTLDGIAETVRGENPAYRDDLPLLVSPDVAREERVPPGQFLTSKWPVLHVGAPPPFDEKQWRLRIFGAVEETRTLTYEDVLKLPQVQLYSDIHCVTRWSKLDNLWVGVQAREFLRLVNIDPAAKAVMLHSGDYTTNIPLGDFLQEDVLFTWMHNGQYIERDHGFPLRVVVPRLYLWKGCKWVDGIEVMTKNKPGYWEIRGYHIQGDPWNEERFW